jgi:Acyclic terpene utilisation family protein AtuA
MAAPAPNQPAPNPPGPNQPDAVLRVANCSGFYGDRLSAAREMVEGGPIDVLTGDWLAELTMLLLAKSRDRGGPGYARTFLTQVEQVLGTCVENGIKIVSNAGGLDPAGCADAVRAIARRAGLPVQVAHVAGDDLLERLGDLMAAGHELANADTGAQLADASLTPLTANAYLGGLPIAAALSAGADIVVTGRVTDAALVAGPGIWRFGWTGADLDALAGAVAAGHIIECGCQATGGNYAFFSEVPDLAQAGFPIAELARDGSAVITKHPGTGGLVSVGTVTAQLLYEIASPRYANPDVVARFDTIRLEQLGPDRVQVTGCRGEPPPADLKVAINYAGGYRNTMTLVIEGLDIAAKAELAEQAIWARIPGGRGAFGEVSVQLVGSDPALLRITVLDSDRARAGRMFSAAAIETALASYPGLYSLTPPGDASSYGVYWPALVPAELVPACVIIDGEQVWAGPARVRPVADQADQPDQPGRRPGPAGGQPGAGSGQPGAADHQPSAGGGQPGAAESQPGAAESQPGAAESQPGAAERQSGAAERQSGAAEHRAEQVLDPASPQVLDTVRVPLGTVAGARSGDKGGNANVGVWARRPEVFAWLDAYLTPDRLAELLPQLAGLVIERHRLPNLLALNFVVVGLLGRGVAASTRLDAQAKALGEELRAAPADIPVVLLAAAGQKQ